MTKDMIKSEVEINTKNAIRSLRLLDGELSKIFHNTGGSKTSKKISDPFNLLRREVNAATARTKLYYRFQQAGININKELLKSSKEYRRSIAKKLALFEHNERLINKVNKAKEKEISLNRRRASSLMGINFALLFGGMAIKRAATNALKGMLKVYDEVMDKTSAFHQSFIRLKGAVTFFKFSLMDALMQSGLFDTFVGWVISAVNWFNRLPAPMKTFFALLIPVAVVLGTIAMIAGQIGLAIIGWKIASLTTLADTASEGSLFVKLFRGYFISVGQNAKILFSGIFSYLISILSKIKTVLMGNKLFSTWFTNISKWGKKTFKNINSNFALSMGKMLIGLAVTAVAWNSIFKGMNDSMGGWLGKGIYDFLTFFQAALSYLGGLWDRFVNWIKGKSKAAYIENGMLKLGTQKDTHASFNEILKRVREENKAFGGSTAENIANAVSESVEVALGAAEGYMLGGPASAALGAGLELNQYFKEGVTNSEIAGFASGEFSSVDLQSQNLSLGQANDDLTDLTFESYNETKEIKELTESHLSESKEQTKILEDMNKNFSKVAEIFGTNDTVIKGVISSTLV